MSNMLNTQKLLYILPDVTYVAELLPAKKEHTFAIQSFRQINGEFLTEDEEFIPNNIEKLFSKLQSESYRLILPDFLFTNTILEVKETSESKVKQYIKDELLPKLGLASSTHEIAAFILTQYGGVTKIQLTALEREVLDAITISAKNHNVKIEGISPLTWTLKSVISLEPSISVVQIGTMLYAAEHYIGVDQCTMTKAEESENVIDTIKTLKGAQPSIQTVYLLTNSLVEEKIKDAVSSTLPVQQLSTYKEDGSQMPSYVKHIIESGMKTLDIQEFAAPVFVLPKEPVGNLEITKETAEEPEVAESEVEAEEAPVAMAKPKPLSVFDDEEDDKDEETETLPSKDDDLLDDDDETNLDDELPAPALPVIVPPVAAAAATPAVPEIATLPTDGDDSDDDVLDDDDVDINEDAEPSPEKATETPKTTFINEDLEKDAEDDDDKIAQFAAHRSDNLSAPIDFKELTAPTPKDTYKEEELNATPEPKTAVPETKSAPAVLSATKQRPVIKNKAGGSFMRMMFVSLIVTAITVAIGVGIFFGINSLNSQQAEASPSPTPSTAPVAIASPSPSPVASPAATVNKGETSVLVVNATTKAGYAGTTTRKLQTAGYDQVTARNARGEYEPGIYVLMATRDDALITALEQDSELELEFASGKNTEDASNQYDVVIVLAE